ncbi:uncharacterized protein LOC119931313 [Tachyglossus aculeatus]|uniref:uncharacterized protein LOC119931313 n=1 Tax=Tachyglossus aculeatus TaxID=9261 RepID=UPI0018F788E2|nr:uncharacterized protein LOC119931313 [Tachyglossus aculeatus]
MVLGFTVTAAVNGSKCPVFQIGQGEAEVIHSEMLLTSLIGSLSETLPLPLDVGDLLNTLLSASMSETAGDSFQSMMDKINTCDIPATEGMPLSYTLLEVTFTEACFLSVYCTQVACGRTGLVVPTGAMTLPTQPARVSAVMAPTLIKTMLSCVVSASLLKKNDYTLMIRNQSLAFPVKNVAILTYVTSVRKLGQIPVMVTTALEIVYNPAVGGSAIETALRMQRATHTAQDPNALAKLIPWCDELARKVFSNAQALFSRVNLPPVPLLGSFAGGMAEPNKDAAVVITSPN